MCNRFLQAAFWIFVLVAAGPALAQDIDANVTVQNRSPSTVADQISDPAERAAFLALYNKKSPHDMLEQAKLFLQRFPQSAFLAQAYEVAAQSSFDLEDYKRGLDYAEKSLTLLPENPLLLVSVADVQAREHLNPAALSAGRAALEYLDRFGRPGAISDRDWPDLRRNLKARASFASGRALLQEALEKPAGDERAAMLKECKSYLSQARSLNPADPEITYLAGLAHLSSQELTQAATDFTAVYTGGGDFAKRALENLRTIYEALDPGREVSFEAFLKQSKNQDKTVPKASPTETNPPAKELSEYAGSESCRGCHGGVFRAWKNVGMSKMLRLYQPQNVFGDFEKNNEFYAGDEAQYRDGELEIIPGANRSLFARMVIRDGRHYFEIQQADGKWHSYPVDYTIGSKWQQAYATKLPNGEIHVFPVQYTALYKKWLNYWKVIDNPGSERADLHSWERLDSSTSYKAICAVCHTSQLRNVQGGGSEPENIEFREPGINCEMCHGPSARHVAEMKDGDPYTRGPLDPPVDFSKISNRDFVSICSQCHMQSAIRKSGPNGELNYSRTGEFFMRYQSIPFGEFSRKGFYKDGRFRQTTFIVESLERSQCFKRGQVTCGTCHDPHSHDPSSNLTSLKFRDQPDQMCTGCHSQFLDSSKAAAHTHHPLNSEGSRCVSCHMPRIMDALLFRARTHQIDDIPSAEMTLRFGQEESPNACLLCHSEKDARWAKDALVSWKAGH